MSACDPHRRVDHVQGGGGFSGWGTDWQLRAGLVYHLGDHLRIVGEASYDVLLGQETDVTTFAVVLGAGYRF